MIGLFCFCTYDCGFNVSLEEKLDRIELYFNDSGFQV